VSRAPRGVSLTASGIGPPPACMLSSVTAASHAGRTTAGEPGTTPGRPDGCLFRRSDHVDVLGARAGARMNLDVHWHAAPADHTRVTGMPSARTHSTTSPVPPRPAAGRPSHPAPIHCRQRVFTGGWVRPADHGLDAGLRGVVPDVVAVRAHRGHRDRGGVQVESAGGQGENAQRRRSQAH
jgi:hypothetical protein